ncbi:MAG: hypothetical protein GXP27_03205 [Planctomycetes bacterium]|nr:hypothetical protein [Planctomycetota bacterium]
MRNNLQWRGSLILSVVLANGFVAETAEWKVELVEPAGAAAVRATIVAKHRLRLEVNPGAEREPLTIRIELPASGPGYWPAEDVVAVDEMGEPIAARHNGTEWEKFTITVPPKRSRYTVQVVRPKGPRPRVFPEKERHATDTATGLSARIANWYGDRRVALCLRFDDSHPTHLSTVIPLLRQHGFRATFLINPGRRDERSPKRWRSAYQEHKAECGSPRRPGIRQPHRPPPRRDRRRRHGARDW